MKLRLLVLLFLAGSLLAGRAMAQGCTVTALTFPTSGNKQIPQQTCITNNDTDRGTTTDGGRLRWDNKDASGNVSHLLELFDHDDSGQRLWCDGQSDQSTTCKPGNILCLQSDGNMVIYEGTDCNTNQGTPVFASNTNAAGDNDGQERLEVEENVSFGGSTRSGDRAVIRNGSKALFVSLGFVD